MSRVIRTSYARVARALRSATPAVVADFVYLPPSGLPALVFSLPGDRSFADLSVGETADEQSVLAWAITATESLRSMHAAGVVHSDIRPELVRIDGERACVVAPCLHLEADVLVDGAAGDPLYRPPGFDASAPKSIRDLVDRDVYSLLMCLYGALSGGTGPWAGQDRSERPRLLSVSNPARKYTLAWDSLFAQGLSHAKPSRFPDASALVTALKVLRPRIEEPPFHHRAIPDPVPDVIPVAAIVGRWQEVPADWVEVGAFFEDRLKRGMPPFDEFVLPMLAGEGAFGRVHTCSPRNGGAECAVKIARTERRADGNSTIPRAYWDEEVARFRTVARVNHENVVMVMNGGDPDFPGFVIMQGLSGNTLVSTLRREGHIRFDVVAEWTQQICSALSALWDHGVRFTDLHSKNVMVMRSRSIRLIDPGVGMPSIGSPPEWRPSEPETILAARPEGVVHPLAWLLVEMILPRNAYEIGGLLPQDRGVVGTATAASRQARPVAKCLEGRLRTCLLDYFRHDPATTRSAEAVAENVTRLILVSLASEPHRRPRSPRGSPGTSEMRPAAPLVPGDGNDRKCSGCRRSRTRAAARRRRARMACVLGSGVHRSRCASTQGPSRPRRTLDGP